jgi:hypothetical protein
LQRDAAKYWVSATQDMQILDFDRRVSHLAAQVIAESLPRLNG